MSTKVGYGTRNVAIFKISHSMFKIGCSIFKITHLIFKIGHSILRLGIQHSGWLSNIQDVNSIFKISFQIQDFIPTFKIANSTFKILIQHLRFLLNIQDFNSRSSLIEDHEEKNEAEKL